LRQGLLTFEESALLMRRFDEGLSGYTYLEEEPAPRIANGSHGLAEIPATPLAETGSAPRPSGGGPRPAPAEVREPATERPLRRG
jgi:arginine decarboxylase